MFWVLFVSYHQCSTEYMLAGANSEHKEVHGGVLLLEQAFN